MSLFSSIMIPINTYRALAFTLVVLLIIKELAPLQNSERGSRWLKIIDIAILLLLIGSIYTFSLMITPAQASREFVLLVRYASTALLIVLLVVKELGFQKKNKVLNIFIALLLIIFSYNYGKIVLNIIAAY